MDKKIINRLNRVSGQIAALNRMINENESCKKTVIQFQAARAAFDSAYVQYLENRVAECIETNDINKIKRIIKNLIKMK